MQNNNNNFVPAVIYNNADAEKSKILKENFVLAGIYQWTHVSTDRKYIGSSNNLSQRLSPGPAHVAAGPGFEYFSKAYLERNKTSYICNALA